MNIGSHSLKQVLHNLTRELIFATIHKLSAGFNPFTAKGV